MASLIHKGKTLLPHLRVASSLTDISFGLMFSSKKKGKEGLLMILPSTEDVRFGASVTMFFVFYSLEILFVNSEYKVVDKVLLRPFKTTYVPKDKTRYVIESTPGTFKDVKIGDNISLQGLE